MVGTRTPATRRRSARFAHRYAASESSRRPALGCIFAHDGPGRRPIEMSERNFFAELKRRNVYKVRSLIASFALAPKLNVSTRHGPCIFYFRHRADACVLERVAIASGSRPRALLCP